MDARRLGALALVALLAVAIPGIVLSFYHTRDPATAHDAVAALDAGPLRYARGAHAWAASLALLLVVVHLARGYVAGRTDAPGRAGALAGLAALALLLAAFFTGTILPWDQQAWEALQHLREGAVGVDVPGETPDEAPLSTIFWAHVLALPATLVLVLAIHLRRAKSALAPRLAGLVQAAWAPALALVLAVVALALLVPPALGPAPLVGLRVSRPDWPFLWLVPLQDWWGEAALLLLPIAFLVAALLLSRRRSASGAARRVTLAVVAGAWLLLTVVGLR